MGHQSVSPTSPLANLIFFEDPTPELVIISGPSGSGKTTACIEFNESLRRRGVSQSGLISIPVYEGCRKIAIALEAIHTGEKRRLSRLLVGSERSRIEPADSDLIYGKWRFDTNTFTWGNSVLSHLPESECFIIDELGPLEFRHGGGLQAGMSLLDNRILRQVVVVVREGLLSSALKRWPWCKVLTFPRDSRQIWSGRELS